MRDPVSKKTWWTVPEELPHAEKQGEKEAREEGERKKERRRKGGKRREERMCVCVCVGATYLAARHTGRQRRGLWEDARRWLETSGEGILPFYSPLGCRMAGVLCAGGKMNERGGTWLGLYGGNNVHLC